MHIARYMPKRMTDAQKIADRLVMAREAAGFASAREAANRMGWAEATYGQHENGYRGIKQKVADRYAEAFGVDASWILFGTGRGPADPLSPAPSGFAEPEVVPISSLPRDRQAMLRQIARAVLPDQVHPTYYVMSRSRPDLLIARGDLLILNLGGTAAPGDIAIVQLYHESGEADTQLRRVVGTHLVGGFDDDQQTVPLESNHIAIRGTVAGVVRTAA